MFWLRGDHSPRFAREKMKNTRSHEHTHKHSNTQTLRNDQIKIYVQWILPIMKICLTKPTWLFDYIYNWLWSDCERAPVCLCLCPCAVHKSWLPIFPYWNNLTRINLFSSNWPLPVSLEMVLIVISNEIRRLTSITKTTTTATIELMNRSQCILLLARRILHDFTYDLCVAFFPSYFNSRLLINKRTNTRPIHRLFIINKEIWLKTYTNGPSTRICEHYNLQQQMGKLSKIALDSSRSY